MTKPVPSHHPDISIIIPVLHEAEGINAHISAIRRLNEASVVEIIVVDGSPQKETVHAITEKNVLCLHAPAGRGGQMNEGARYARGSVLLFLHADTRLPANGLQVLRRTMKPPYPYVGGAFSLGINSPNRILRFIASVANVRSKLTRIPYGDQAQFFEKDFFFSLGGFKDIPIMEDVEIMERIRGKKLPICILPDKVLTSPRRWEAEGVLKRTLQNWQLRIRYRRGESPHALTSKYRPNSTNRETQ